MSIDWVRYPCVAAGEHARAWLQMQANLGLARHTVDAYGRSLNDYLQFSAGTDVVRARRDHVATWVNDRRSRPGRGSRKLVHRASGAGLAAATLQLRITAVRLFYDFLVEEGLRATNPVGRGQYTPGQPARGSSGRGLVPRLTKLPWIPTEDQWLAVVQAARDEPLRNRLMLTLQYDAALRREELCSLTAGDLDPAHRLVQVRAETTKGRARDRIVPYSAATDHLLAAYLAERRTLARASGWLFVSASRRNRGQPISAWTWSKAVAGLAARSGVERFTTHTPRHLRLTDLARAGWDLHELAAFAGHRSIQTTLLYVHLSGRDLSAKLARTMGSVHVARATRIAEALA